MTLSLFWLACKPVVPPTAPDEELHVLWGDLHAHTNLSHDGCERPDLSCSPAEALPGQHFFAEAEARGLAFAALTDHAEVSAWSTAGAPSIDAWGHTLALVAAAEPLEVLPLAGYEWTGRYPTTGDRSDWRGGHRTVVFESPTPCAAARVPGPTPAPRKPDSSEAYTLRADGANNPMEMEARLRAAMASEPCDSRALSWFHHPATQRPPGVDWSHDANHIDTDLLVEILSEHGAFECHDPADDGCDWRLPAHHDPRGSVRRALAASLRLGFVGGTDAHDARPGSLDDGGGAVADPGARAGTSHPYAGGLTGVFVHGELSRGSLFDALEARATIASSFPLRGLRIDARDVRGQLFLPGAVVPEASWPLNVVVHHDDPRVTETTVELIVDGVLETSGTSLAIARPRTAAYLRIRLDLDGNEERAFVSPWFVEST